MDLTWKSVLPIDPLPTLLSWQDAALLYFVRRDLLDEAVESIEILWNLPEARRLIDRQQANGSWAYPGKSYDPITNANYDLLETYRNLRILVEMYGFRRGNSTLDRAAEYVFSCQTSEGDIRGIIGNQYMPYYHGVLLELLNKTGYTDDPRVEKGLRWLLSMRQEDGGWVIPAQLVPARQKTGQLWHGAPVQPERNRPHAHLATGMVLRAFTAHPDYRRRPELIVAGERLKARFFQADKYNDRRAPSYWLKFQFPFWWPNLLTALETLFWLGFDRRDQDIARGLDWFVENQSADGLWETGFGSGSRAAGMRCWVGLAVCRMLKRFFERERV